jgi:succinylglutamate desuccinylase
MKREKLDIQGAVRFSGEQAGPSLVILGGIHGNEPCGVYAVEKLLAMLTTGELVLTRGALTLITANTDALKQNVRFLVVNLNRLFKDNSSVVDCAEIRRAEELKPLLSKASHVLDLHSTSQPSPPFIVCEEGDKSFAERLGVDWIVTGWAALDPALDGDTCTWASKHGAQAVTLECGQHTDPTAPEFAFAAAMRALVTLEMVCVPHAKQPSKVSNAIKLYHAHILIQPDFSYSRMYQGFDLVAAGECIGRDSQGEYLAPQAGRIIFPADPKTTALNTELYMLGYDIAEQG